MIPPPSSWKTFYTETGKTIKYLPEGIHIATLTELKKYFVFSNSRTREIIYNHLLQYIKDLKEIIKTDFTIILDGSFITSIIDPADVDLIVLLNHDDIKKIPPDKIFNFFMNNNQLNRWTNSEKKYYCDSYYVVIDYIKDVTKTNIFKTFNILTYKTEKKGKIKRINTKKQKGLVKIEC